MADSRVVIYKRYATHIGADVIWNCVRIIDGTVTHFIPCDPANTDYQAYLAWVAEGNTAEEWQPDGE